MFTCQQHFNKSITFEQVTTFQHVNNISTRQHVDMLPDGVSAHVRRLSVLHLQGHDAQGPDVNLVCTFICICIYICVCVFVFWFLFIFVFVFLLVFVCICFMFIHKAVMLKVPPWCHMPAGSQSGEEDKKQSGSL